MLARDDAVIEQSGDFCTWHQKRTLLHGLLKIPAVLGQTLVPAHALANRFYSVTLLTHSLS